MATLKSYKHNLYDIIDDSNNYSGQSFFITSLFDTEIGKDIPMLQVTNTIWNSPFYNGVSKQSVAQAIKYFFYSFNIVMDNKQYLKFFDKVYSSLLKIENQIPRKF